MENRDYTGRKILEYELFGTKVPARNYKKMLLRVARMLQERYPDTFDSLAVQVQGDKPYFSEQREDLKDARKLPKGPLFIETNFSANKIVEVCYALISKFGLPADSLKLCVEPVRSRAIKGTVEHKPKKPPWDPNESD